MSSGPVSIRPAVAGDAERVTEIVEAAYSVYIERIGRRPVPMDYDYAALIQQGKTFVTEGEPLAGVVVLEEGDGEFILYNVAVAPGRQGEGLGRALIAFAEDQARERGYGSVVLYTHKLMTENQALYASLGYRPIDHADEPGIPRVFMAKDV